MLDKYLLSQSLYFRLTLTCQYAEDGCGVSTTLENIKQHEAECDYNPFNSDQQIVCPRGCNTEMKRAELKVN